jgi:SAM-dependent methyltransferase
MRPRQKTPRRADGMTGGGAAVQPIDIRYWRFPMSESVQTIAPSPDFSAIKVRQQAAWSAGNYAIVGTTLQIVGETLCEAADIKAGERVLDVAAGNGNASLAAARRFAAVTSTDYVPSLLDNGRRRAEADGLAIDFHVADAEDLPFPDDTFDAVLSTFGVMFAPDQERAARELMRVLRPGGRIGLANWTPTGFIGQMFGVLGRHVPPVPGLRPPSRWGNPDWLHDTFGPGAARISTTAKDFMFRYASPEHWLEIFRTWYGPVHMAFRTLDAAAQQALADDLIALVKRCNRRDAEVVVVPSQYMEVIIEKAE